MTRHKKAPSAEENLSDLTENCYYNVTVELRVGDEVPQYSTPNKRMFKFMYLYISVEKLREIHLITAITQTEHNTEKRTKPTHYLQSQASTLSIWMSIESK